MREYSEAVPKPMVPIGYRPRYEHEGKKIRWIDGVDAVYTLLKCRFT